MEESTRNYLHSKAAHLSGLKRKADATATATIPLTTTHGGHPIHVQILSHATARPLEELTAKQKKRRTQSAAAHQRIVQAPIPPIPPPLIKLTPRECLTFAQLSGQQTHRALRAMRSFLNDKGMNFLCSDKTLRIAEKNLELPLHIYSTEPIAFRVEDLSTPLTLMLTQLLSSEKLKSHRHDGGALSLQVQLVFQ